MSTDVRSDHHAHEAQTEHRLLCCLEPAIRQSVVATARRRTFAKDEVILIEGAPADALYLLLRGRVAAQTTTATGETATVNVLGPGDAFGELALLHHPTNPRIASVVALEPAEALTITRPLFEELRRREPAVDRLLVELLAAQVTSLTSRLTDAYFVPVDVRVCRCLISLAEVYRDVDDRVVVTLTQETIASMIGATRPSVNKVLRELGAQGALALTRGRIEIRDRAHISRRAA